MTQTIHLIFFVIVAATLWALWKVYQDWEDQ